MFWVKKENSECWLNNNKQFHKSPKICGINNSQMVGLWHCFTRISNLSNHTMLLVVTLPWPSLRGTVGSPCADLSPVRAVSWREESRQIFLSKLGTTLIYMCLPVYLSICLSIHLSSYLSIYPTIYLSVCLCVCLSVCLSIRLSVYLSICLCICLYTCICVNYVFIFAIY